VPRDPGNLSAFGLLTVDVRTDDVQTAVRRSRDLDPAEVERAYAELQARSAATLRKEGFAEPDARFVRTADLRYFGQAFEVRVPVPDGPLDADAVADAFHDAHAALYGYSFRGDERQAVEWVNLRVSGVGPIPRPQLPALPLREGDAERARTGTRTVVFEDARETPVYWRPDLSPGDVLHGPAVLEEFGSTIPLHPGFRAEVDGLGNVRVTRGGCDDRRPGRARDRRGQPRLDREGGRDRHRPHLPLADDPRRPRLPRRHPRPPLRKLTGRSYSALVHPVVRDFPLETMRPGDVFFHNDVYLSEGGIGTCPTCASRCRSSSTARSWRSCRPSATTTTSAAPARVHAERRDRDLPGGAHGPADPAVGPGRPQPGGADDHDPQLRDARLARRRPRRRVLGLPHGRRRLTELFERYGRATVEACFDALIDKTTETFRREVLSKIPDGTWVWEDYAEHDGVDEPQLHTQRITLTKTADGLVIDFTGTSRQARGPINHCGDYADGNFLKKWLAPDPAQPRRHPERMAELDVNEGVVPLIEMRSRRRGRCSRRSSRRRSTPAPSSSCGCSACWPACSPRRRRPDAGRPGDDPLHRRLRHRRRRRAVPHARGARRRLGRPYYADGEDTIHVVPDSRNLPTSSPSRASRSSSSGSGWPRTPAARGSSAAGSATRSTSGCCATARSCASPTARSWPAGG
jgi:hypothetical protein